MTYADDTDLWIHIFGYLNTLLSMERVVNVSGDMTDKSCYLRQRIFPGLVCERQTSDSNSQVEFVATSKFSMYFLTHKKIWQSPKTLSSGLLPKETILKFNYCSLTMLRYILKKCVL